MSQQPQQELRINHRIRVPEVQLIGSDGAQKGVMKTFEARKLAEDEGLDLVEVAPRSQPPVCRLMDYGKYKYDMKKKAADSKRNTFQIEVKEIKIRPKIAENDFETKINNIKRFLGEGHKARVVVMFRGREITHVDIGHNLLDRMIAALSGIGYVENQPSMMGRDLSMIVAPVKKGTK